MSGLGSLKSIASKGLDPGNVFNTRPKGFNIMHIIDPLGGMTQDTSTPAAAPAAVSVADRKTAQAKKDKLARYSKLRTKRPIMTAQLNSDDTLG